MEALLAGAGTPAFSALEGSYKLHILHKDFPGTLQSMVISLIPDSIVNI
jgi:hypothetical protein